MMISPIFKEPWHVAGAARSLLAVPLAAAGSDAAGGAS
jgi:hypothetical protein